MIYSNLQQSWKKRFAIFCNSVRCYRHWTITNNQINKTKWIYKALSIKTLSTWIT